jgi:hypothetical protein
MARPAPSHEPPTLDLLLALACRADPRRRRILARLCAALAGWYRTVRDTQVMDLTAEEDELRSALRADPEGTCRTCRICGCTDDRACPGGCTWADPWHTLCSTCEAEIAAAVEAQSAAIPPRSPEPGHAQP